MLITSWYYDERDQMFKKTSFRGIKKGWNMKIKRSFFT